MFARHLTEVVLRQEKTIVQNDFGQFYVWTNQELFRASVVNESTGESTKNTVSSRVAVTDVLYAIISRNLDRNWTFESTRFVWLSSDGDPDNNRYLEPVEDQRRPGRRGHRWLRIVCKDVTNRVNTEDPPP